MKGRHDKLVIIHTGHPTGNLGHGPPFFNLEASKGLYRLSRVVNGMRCQILVEEFWGTRGYLLFAGFTR